MIIELDNILFSVDYAVDDEVLYLTIVKLNGHELIDLLSEKTIERLEGKVEQYLDEENQEAKYENAIDAYEAGDW